MPTLWFTADTHFGHGNIIRFCGRPFLSREEILREETDPDGSWNVSAETVARHDDAILAAINERVAESDILWILGDFCLGPFAMAKAYRDRIRCRHVHLVWGNHDSPAYAPLFGKTMDQGMVKHRSRKIWLNHYPMRSWDKAFHGSWHLYGHVHGRLLDEDATNPRMLVKDVGVDACGFAPVSFEELEDYMAPREDAFWAWRESLER